MKYAEARKLAEEWQSFDRGDKSIARTVTEWDKRKMTYHDVARHCFNHFDKALKALHIELLFLNKHSPARATVLRGIIKELEEVEGI